MLYLYYIASIITTLGAGLSLYHFLQFCRAIKHTPYMQTGQQRLCKMRTNAALWVMWSGVLLCLIITCYVVVRVCVRLY